jgi:hypothetical protein
LFPAPLCPYHIAIQLLINGKIFGRKKLAGPKMRVLSISEILSQIFPIPRRTQRCISINVFRNSGKGKGHPITGHEVPEGE